MASSSRGTAWGEETKTLILIWGDIKIQAELDGKSRKQVFEKIEDDKGRVQQGLRTVQNQN